MHVTGWLRAHDWRLVSSIPVLALAISTSGNRQQGPDRRP